MLASSVQGKSRKAVCELRFNKESLQPKLKSGSRQTRVCKANLSLTLVGVDVGVPVGVLVGALEGVHIAVFSTGQGKEGSPFVKAQLRKG